MYSALGLGSLPQKREFNVQYVGVLFMSEGEMDQKMDRPLSAGIVLDYLVKRLLSRNVKLWIYQSIYIPTRTYTKELCVMEIANTSGQNELPW